VRSWSKGRKQAGGKVKNEYGILYLFRRIGGLNPRGYKRYAAGSVLAICEFSATLCYAVLDPTNVKVLVLYIQRSVLSMVCGSILHRLLFAHSVIAKAINTFAGTDPHVRRTEGDRIALWSVLLLSSMAVHKFPFIGCSLSPFYPLHPPGFTTGCLCPLPDN